MPANPSNLGNIGAFISGVVSVGTGALGPVDHVRVGAVFLLLDYVFAYNRQFVQ